MSEPTIHTDEFGQLVVRGATIIMYAVGREIEVDITLSDGGAIGFDVAKHDIHGKDLSAELREALEGLIGAVKVS
jgi:hypothetical protein